ncbi:MAG: DsbC family protein [Nitrospirae bacterium]|nr:DsbC family protein [Nitrospirota bacterium]
MKTAITQFKAIILSFVIMLSLNPVAYAFDKMGEGCSTDCNQCHKIKLEEAANILKNFTELKVLSVSEGPVRGMWEVQVETQGSRLPIYLHYSRKYFFTGNIIDIENKKVVSNLPEPAPASREKIDVSNIPLDDAIIIGKPSSVNKVIVFDDPDCPFCRKLHAELKEVVSKRDDIVFYIKLFPLVELHPKSYDKSKAIVCSKSFKLLDDAFSGKDIPPPSCETKQIDKNIELASKLGITGTPTLILTNGEVIPGYAKADALINMIDSAKQGTGSKK